MVTELLKGCVAMRVTALVCGFLLILTTACARQDESSADEQLTDTALQQIVEGLVYSPMPPSGTSISR
jgi:hypothetical protein